MDTIKINKKQALMVAHRGVSGLERENTCPAFVAAGSRSYFGVETDVHVSRDKQFVIIHDESTKRVSNESYDINVETNDYAAVKNLVLPDRDGSTCRQDIRIPLLSEYISICKKYEKKCVL
jgi:glycerophosphoryl diester phosphodiesterase